MKETNMTNLGLDGYFLQEASEYKGLTAGRISSQYRKIYKVITEDEEMLAEVSGKFRFAARDLSDYPAVGDFVMIDRADDKSGNAIIHHVLKRKSVFCRRAAGTSNDVQVVAANIDTIFICMSLNQDFNLRRLERYLSITWDSGALPVVVLTKKDVCDDLEEKLKQTHQIATGADVIVTTSMDKDGYLPLKEYIKKGQTVAFIGSSGVGKSTLINRLVGYDMLSTNGIRKDDRGKHTTTRRELFILPEGGAVIDTPGMRELGIESADLSKSFADIDELSGRCRFKDCAHENEPYCAVKEAIANGRLSKERFENYLKLQKEAKYDGLNSRQIEAEKINRMFESFGGMKNARDFIKQKNNQKGRH